MDGAKGSGAGYQEYNFKDWFATIQRYEGKGVDGRDADCMLFGAEAYTTVRWIGNEHGLAARILGRNQQWMIKQIQSTVIMLEVIR